jgi:hypothetical protein
MTALEVAEARVAALGWTLTLGGDIQGLSVIDFQKKELRIMWRTLEDGTFERAVNSGIGHILDGFSSGE